ncbi:uncharacterized protein RHO25_005603 [Cercospora beticola]|uniref:Uncharacterized protein n=1 Tax=Cercospora beticola TaxID=122368 RepID=A0ABZ0NN52_CERBT|nr:hypothetical protein RHO25_005603 [Cercospora beticola]CAK1360756.1 unnamed protein product [Cercospora beticola]
MDQQLQSEMHLGYSEVHPESRIDDRYVPPHRHHDELASTPVQQESAWERIGRNRQAAVLAAEELEKDGVHGQADHQSKEHDAAGGDNTKKKHNLGKRLRGLFCIN